MCVNTDVCNNTIQYIRRAIKKFLVDAIKVKLFKLYAYKLFFLEYKTTVLNVVKIEAKYKIRVCIYRTRRNRV